MLKTIFGWSLVAVVAAVVVLLFINGGGFRAIRETAGTAPSLRGLISGIASSSTQFTLPGQDRALYNLGIDPETGESYPELYGELSGSGGASGQYDAPSPNVRTVDLEASNPYATNASDEYVTLYASGENTLSIDVSGWSVVSERYGMRLVIPLAAPSFIPGASNRVSGVSLAPGGSALIYTGISPIGVSFRENQCTAYLNHPPSYSACVSDRSGNADFYLSSWRLFAGYTKEVWSNSGDTLVLLDGQGRAVDTVAY